MLAADIHATLAAAARTAGIDPRNGFARARAEGASWRVESSDSAWLEAAVTALERAGARARGHRIEPWSDRVGWIMASVAEVRREPQHAAEQVTQALQGEALVPYLHEDGWVLGRCPDGYMGWVRDWHLRFVDPGAPPAHDTRADARIEASQITLRSAPRRDAAAVGESVLGTRVVIRERDRGWAAVELPGGRTGWVPQWALRHGTSDWPADVRSILAMTERFRGVPYLWGGRSPKGFDCSGLVQFVFGLHGIALPRDSDQQARAGVAADVPGAGDLVFFGRERVTHVGVATGERTFLHARGEVRCNSTIAGTPLHDAELWALHCGTRRVLERPSPAARG